MIRICQLACVTTTFHFDMHMHWDRSGVNVRTCTYIYECLLVSRASPTFALLYCAIIGKVGGGHAILRISTMLMYVRIYIRYMTRKT